MAIIFTALSEMIKKRRAKASRSRSATTARHAKDVASPAGQEEPRPKQPHKRIPEREEGP